MTDYYLPVYTKSGWTGTLKKLRIDPLDSANRFEIDSLTLMTDASHDYVTYPFVNASGAESADWYYWHIGPRVVTGGAIAATATNNTPIIQMKSDVNLDISDVSHLKIRVKGYAGDNIRVYFSTAADPIMNEAKAIGCRVTNSVMTDYYLKMNTLPTWTGTLKKLRIDPLDSANGFEIESMTLLHTANPITVRVNGVDVPLWCNPVMQGAHTMIPMSPDTGVFYYFNAYFEWDKATNRLKMYANNQSIVLTMDSPTAFVNGVPVALGCRPYLYDGIPMVPVDALVNAFGYNAAYGPGTVDIVTSRQPLSMSLPQPRKFLIELK